MLAAFPTPVLSVTADAVKELDGREALSSLWNLFTKCKESLQDGHRLENISWRLWYREMMFTNALNLSDKQSFPCARDEWESKSDIIDMVGQDEKSYQHLAPSEVEPFPPSKLEVDGGVPSLTSNNTPPPHLGHPTPTPSLPPAPSPSPSHSSLAPQQRRPSFITRGRRNSFLVGGTPISVGKIIYDMLPTSPASPAPTCPPLTRPSKSLDELSRHGIARLSIPGPGHFCAPSSPSLITQPGPHPSNHNSPPSSSLSATTLTVTIADGVGSGVSMKCTLPDPTTFVTYLPTPATEIGELGSTASTIVSSIPSRTDLTSESTSIPPSTSNIPNESIPTKPDSIASIPRPTLVYSGPPSPSLSESYACAHPAEVEIKEVGLLASLSPATTKGNRLGQTEPFNTSSASQLPQLPQLLHQPPQLIVVDPTPNPTPHPTPPATPLMTGDGARRSHFLTLPGAVHVSRRQSQPQHSPLQTLSNGPEPDRDRSSAIGSADLMPNEESHDQSADMREDEEEEERHQRLSPALGHQHEMVPRNANRNSVSSITSSNHSHTTNTTTSSEYSRTQYTTDTSIAEDDSGADTNDKPVSTPMPTAMLSRMGGSASTLTLQYMDHADSLLPLPPSASLLQSPKKKKRNSGPITTSVNISTMNGQPVASSSSIASPQSASSTQTGSVPSCTGLKRRASAVAGGGPIARRTSSGRNSSRSRSTGGSSAGMGSGKSKTRNNSRDSVNKGLGMTAGCGVKKTSVTGSGRGRAKFVLGRASAAMASRNAAVTKATSAVVLDDVARKLSQQIEDGLKQGKARMGEQELEAEMHRQEMRRKQHEQEEQKEEVLATQLKERAELAMREMARRQLEIQKQEEERKQQEPLTHADTARRPNRFNFGSNSDTKSAGSGSDVSGGRSAQEASVFHAANAGLLVSLVMKGKERAVGQPLAEPPQQAFLQPSQRQMSKQQLQQPQKPGQRHGKHPPNQQQSSAKEKPNERGRVEEGPHKCREKGKQKDGSTGASTGKSGRHTNGAVDPDLVAKVNQSLGSPLLPQNKRTIVLATSESDFETDSEDDGSWSSEEIGADDIEQRRKQSSATAQQQQEAEHQQQQEEEQQRKLQEQQLQRRQHSNARLPAVQRTNSSHYPTTNNNRAKQSTRLQQQRQAQSNTQALVEKAALEAQRQRDMFTKLPTESFQDLAKARVQSGGLLTQLMNPNPEIFPLNHPYRRGFSSGEIRPVSGISSLAPVQPLTNDAQTLDKSQVRAPSNPAEAKVQTKKPNPPSARPTLSPPGRLSFMQLTKKAPVKPVSSHVAVGSMHSKTGVVAGLTDMLSNVKNSQGSSSGYRPRGRPKDQELEDESDTDNDPGIQVSKSIAQERLKAYAERRNIKASHSPVLPLSTAVPPEEESDVPVWARVSQPHHNRSQSQGQDPQRRPPNGFRLTQTPSQDSRLPAAPIPLGHPYNLPHPAPPSTPRTTRRLMLSTELSESLRRNLLWERQVSKVNLSAVRRTASSGGSRHSVLGRLQPLTAAPSMVQLLPKGTTQPPGPNNRVATDRDRRSSGGAANNQQDREGMQQQAMARNRSWADDYHYKGW